MSQWTQIDAHSKHTLLVRGGEAKLDKDGLVLVRLVDLADLDTFYGSVMDVDGPGSKLMVKSKDHFLGKDVYLCGDLGAAASVTVDSPGGSCGLVQCLQCAASVRVIKELSRGEIKVDGARSVRLGRVPLDVHGVGAFYPQFFDPGTNYFKEITVSRVFMSPLTNFNRTNMSFNRLPSRPRLVRPTALEFT